MNIEEIIEETILHNLMLENSKIAIAIDLLTENHFTKENNRKLFSIILNLYGSGIVVDVVSLADNLAADMDLQNHAIDICTGEYPSSGAFTYYCGILANIKTKSDCKKMCLEYIQKIDSGYPYQSPQEFGSRMMEISTSKSQYPDYKAKELANNLTDLVSNAQQGFTKYYDLGIPILSENLRLKDGMSLVVVALPKTGKTWLMAWVANFLSKKYRVAIESAEMYPEDIFLRMASSYMRDDLSSLLYTPKAPTRLFEKFSDAMSELRERDLVISQVAGMEYSLLKSRIMKHVKDGYKIIFLDYIQRVPNAGADSIRTGVLQISRELTNLAKRERFLLIMFSQANDEAAKAGKTLPQHSKESRSIREDADAIICLTDKTENPVNIWKDMLIYVEQRNGFSGDINLKFNPGTGQYVKEIPENWGNDNEK